MDLFENRNKKLDIPHLSTAKYVQFALSIQYFSYIVDYVCSILQQNHLHIHISQFTTHNSLLVSRIPHLTILYLHHSSHNSLHTSCLGEHRHQGTNHNGKVPNIKHDLPKGFPWYIEAHIIHHIFAFETVIGVTERSPKQHRQTPAQHSLPKK